MMRVDQRKRQGSPTTCQNCHIAVLPGDQYYVWQTWNQVYARCLNCGVPTRSLVSISRLKSIYTHLELSIVDGSYISQWSTILHVHLVRARKAYLGKPGKHPHTPRGKDRQKRAEVLTLILTALERLQPTLGHVQCFREEALALLNTVDPLEVYMAAKPLPIPKLTWTPTAQQYERIQTLRASGYSNRMISKKLKLPEADVRRVGAASETTQ